MKKRSLINLFAVALVGALWTAPALAQSKNKFATVNAVGDVTVATTPSSGKIHLSGGLGVVTADYFRGQFDGIPEDLDDLAINPALALTLELPTPAGLPLKGMTLTFGTSNGLATDPDIATGGDVDSWYESDNYIGLAARLGKKWLLGLTYTAYTTPNDIFPTLEELALAVAYKNKWHPQFKVAVPVDSADGIFTSVGIAPSIKVLKHSSHPLTLKLPVVVGYGFDNYYGRKTDDAAFASVGLTAGLPLKSVPSDYGDWTLTAGVHLLARSDDLQELGSGAHDDAFIPRGMVRISFVY